MSLLNRKFSHIYIEKEAKDHELTNKILKKLPNSHVIYVNHYKDVFNRPGQSFLLQKKSPKLILAVKKDNFIYKGSDLCDNYGETDFYYTTPILNCIYDCDYCFLRGMYVSGNIVIFVNQEDFFSHIQNEFANKKAYIAISYETDLLALDPLTGIVGKWLDFAKRNPNITIEIRTKSNITTPLMGIMSMNNVIVSWTVSPDFVIENYERFCPRLMSRINAIKRVLGQGWNIRICLDPVIFIKNWERHYGECFKVIFREIDPDRILDMTVGFFRMGKDVLKRARKNCPNSKVLFYPFVLKKDEYTYKEDMRKEGAKLILEILRGYLPDGKINMRGY